MLSYRLFISDATLGVLNLYSRARDAFTDQVDEDGQVFATHATIALIGVQTEAQLHTAIHSRDLIGMAKGILMHRHHLDPVRAFQMLVQLSQSTNMKLNQVAAYIVDHPGELSPDPPTWPGWSSAQLCVVQAGVAESSPGTGAEVARPVEQAAGRASAFSAIEAPCNRRAGTSGAVHHGHSGWCSASARLGGADRGRVG